jgi:hypothetical protein
MNKWFKSLLCFKIDPKRSPLSPNGMVTCPRALNLEHIV